MPGKGAGGAAGARRAPRLPAARPPPRDVATAGAAGRPVPQQSPLPPKQDFPALIPVVTNQFVYWLQLQLRPSGKKKKTEFWEGQGAGGQRQPGPGSLWGFWEQPGVHRREDGQLGEAGFKLVAAGLLSQGIFLWWGVSIRAHPPPRTQTEAKQALGARPYPSAAAKKHPDPRPAGVTGARPLAFPSSAEKHQIPAPRREIPRDLSPLGCSLPAPGAFASAGKRRPRPHHEIKSAKSRFIQAAPEGAELRRGRSSWATSVPSGFRGFGFSGLPGFCPIDQTGLLQRAVLPLWLSQCRKKSGGICGGEGGLQDWCLSF